MTAKTIVRTGFWLVLAAVVLNGGQAVAMADPSKATIPEHPAYEPPDISPFAGVKDLFAGAKVTASGHWKDREPKFAVDARHDQPNDHWACEDLPVWLTVELAEPKELNAIRLWTFWGERRSYQYIIEASLDGKEWSILVDQKNNAAPATAQGEEFFFPAVKAKYIRTTFTNNSAGKKAGGHIVEIEAYSVDPKVAAELSNLKKAWTAVAKGLHGAVASTDVQYVRHAVPAVESSVKWAGTAWQGERLNAQFLLWTNENAAQVRLITSPLKDGAGNTLAATCVRPSFVRYVLADKQLLPDVLDDAVRLEIPARSVRPVWVNVDVPADAKAGVYRGELQVKGAGDISLRFSLEVEVLPLVLPPASQWKFRLDLWQSPYSVARYHHVKPWSKEHWLLLEPVLRMLADAGQKCLTTTIVHDPWSSQTYDAYDSMIEWSRSTDGQWRWDYTVFDQYVEFGRKCGITDSISCYSMAPWSDQVRYLDEKTGEYVWAKAPAGTKEFDALWRPFLKDFAAHLKQKGWLERTSIAMDERPPEVMKPIIALVREAAPGMRIALAGGPHLDLKDQIEDWCVFIDPALEPTVAIEREKNKGWPTTFYVCCGPTKPNTFVFSPPAESAWMGWYAAAKDYTGLLRWAYNLWVEDPLYDTSYVRWPAGDCFLVYPGPRSSIHFERLREGIADYEKIRLVREALGKRTDERAKESLARLNEALKRFTYAEAQKTPAADVVNPARKLLVELSREVMKR